MFKRLFGRAPDPNRAVTDALYGAIVAAARQPALYSAWNVPDTPLGRFEMLSLHMFLMQHRLRAETGPLRDIAQELIDTFFTEVDHSLRELGIGDSGVPKRMKKLSRMHYGRTLAYADALEQDDAENLAAALRRNVSPDDPDALAAAPLAAYVLGARRALAAQPDGELMDGRAAFPNPDTAQAG